MNEYKEVRCPKCNRTLSHHLEGTESVYRNTCPKCKATVLIYSAGRTMLIGNEITTIEINIKF